MAILKHTSSKNAAYGDALEYLKYKHREDSKTGLYEPILDEYGLLEERENTLSCALDGHGREMDPESWAGGLHGNQYPLRQEQHQGRAQAAHLYHQPSGIGCSPADQGGPAGRRAKLSSGRTCPGTKP